MNHRIRVVSEFASLIVRTSRKIADNHWNLKPPTIAFAMASMCTFTGHAVPDTPFNFPLQEGWSIQSSTRTAATGETLSRAGFDTSGWTPTSVPKTVLGALVDHGIYGDVFFGRNLEKIPSDDFQAPWWYRTEFELPAAQNLDHSRLCLDGINYRAEVWLNGRRIADETQLVGAFRRHELDVSDALQAGRNVLAVKVSPPQPGDYTVGFVDWNPLPPDRNMGLFRGVRLVRSGPVRLVDPFVRTDVDLATLDSAVLTVETELVNNTDRVQSMRLLGDVENIHFELPFELAPRERRLLRVSPAEVPALQVRDPRLWWPLHYGEPNLYRLNLRAVVADRKSDEQLVVFGIRTVGDYLTPEGHRGYTVNGKRILIRGGGWVDDLFLRESPGNLEAQFDYVRAMNLNTVRLEGFWGASEQLYDLADEKGILLMAGWSCQWEWAQYLGVPIEESDTFGGPRSAADIELVAGYLRDHARWLRNHPSLLVWVLGSDKLPWPDAEARYRADLATLDPTRPVLAACKRLNSPLSGDSGVKMAGPYQYVPPDYWFDPRAPGGGFGFNTETGPGPQVPPMAGLRRMMPADELWPVNATWDYHCGRFAFGDLKVYLAAFDARYGGAKSVEELAYKAQAANFEAMRAMFESFGAGRPRTTGLIQWMLNASWPKLYWQLYGYDLLPNGAYYGAKKGSTPLHVVFNPVSRVLSAVNDTLSDLASASLEILILDPESRVVFEKRLPVSCPAESASPLLELRVPEGGAPMHFFSLKLRDAAGRMLSDNFYWISAKRDEMDYAKSEWWGTPIVSHADFTALNRLPVAEVEVVTRFVGRDTAEVTLKNNSACVAFLIEMQLEERESQAPVLPVFWDDNYVSLLPHESRTIGVRFRPSAADAGRHVVAVQGWNVRVKAAAAATSDLPDSAGSQ